MQTSYNFLQTIVNFAPTLKQLFLKDVAITISDREKVIYHENSEKFVINDYEGTLLSENEPMAQVMQRKKTITMDVPVELLGFEGKITVAPIIDENRNVVGSIGIAASLDEQVKLMNIAEQFTATTEEISASTEELSSSAIEFKNYIEHLDTSQQEMRQQVENTTKILEMINSVAKNTRILGFNAGIEAARSGEYGRGFSVVAKEITKLADQSAASVNEIRNLLDQLNEKVEQAGKIVKDTVYSAVNQSSSIEEISAALKHLTDVSEDIEKLSKKV